MHIKNRPRIPTPDVTKEVVERENQNRNASTATNNFANPPVSSASLTLMPQQLPTYPGYSSSDIPVVQVNIFGLLCSYSLKFKFKFQVVLSPIQELDGTGSVNNTLHAHSPGTAALAQAVLSPTLGPLLTTPVSVPMTVSQLTQLGFSSARNSPLFARAFESTSVKNPTFIQAFEEQKPGMPMTSLTLTELTQEQERRQHDMDPIENSGGSSGDSEFSHQSKDSIGSSVSNTTASVSSKRSLEANLDDTQPHSFTTQTSVPITLHHSSRLSTVDESEKAPSLNPSASAPNSLSSLGGSQGVPETPKLRKVSSQSQTAAATPKRGEVYV